MRPSATSGPADVTQVISPQRHLAHAHSQEGRVAPRFMAHAVCACAATLCSWLADWCAFTSAVCSSLALINGQVCSLPRVYCLWVCTCALVHVCLGLCIDLASQQQTLNEKSRGWGRQRVGWREWGMAIKDEGAVGRQKSLPFKSAGREQGQIFCATKSRESI